MLKYFGVLLCVGLVGAIVELQSPCNPSTKSQMWNFDHTTPSSKLQLLDGTCLVATACSNLGDETPIDVTVKNCSESAICPDSGDFLWTFDNSTGFLASNIPSSGAKWCLTLAGTSGPSVNLWPCSTKNLNSEWTWLQNVALKTKFLADSCLGHFGGSGSVLQINGSDVGRRFDGVGGLAAVGGARLLYDYPEPQRTEILDLMFLPTGGAATQILKLEMEGDMDSSYGSGPSYSHTANESEQDISRGIYLSWLQKEARARNPDIVLYSLPWGSPGYVGDGSFLSEGGIEYKMQYYKLARETYGIEFDWVGVWNEQIWSRNYTLSLRKALDAAGFENAKIAVPDGSGKDCVDCPSGWDIFDAVENDQEFAQAVGTIGIHGSSTAGVDAKDGWEATGVSYWNSEANQIDGSMPQWDPVAENDFGAGLSWPRMILRNYVNARATATILCPLTHSWTHNYGRQNHGFAQFVSPYDGNYELSSAFWSQAHITQLTEAGWHFLDGEGSAEFCSNGDDPTSCYFVYGTLTNGTEYTFVGVNTGSADLNFTLQFVGRASELAGRTLSVWKTDVSGYFVSEPSTKVSPQGTLHVVFPTRSVVSVSTLTSASRSNPSPPPRKLFPLPYTSDFSSQRVGDPGKYLSDLYGAFTVSNQTPAALNQNPYGSAQTLWQGVPAPPNSWHNGFDGSPFSSFFSGTNFANVNVSVEVLLQNSGDVARLCGRVPLFKEQDRGQSCPLGVCLEIATADNTWKIVEGFTGPSQKIISSGNVPLSLLTWHQLRLVFLDYQCTPYVDNTPLSAPLSISTPSGVVGLGTDWNVAYFDDLSISETRPAPSNPFILSIYPGQLLRTNITGWAGLVLNLTSSTSDITVSSLARFKVQRNSDTHTLNIYSPSSQSFLLDSPPSVNMATCTADLLGFCSISIPPTKLAQNQIYYIVSSEKESSDAVLEMYNPAAGTSHANRDGDTAMVFQGPGRGMITGRVLLDENASKSTLILETHTSFGPVNFEAV